MAGYNRTRYVEQLLEKTESLPPSFAVHLHSEHWVLNNGSKFLYNNQIAVSDWKAVIRCVLTRIAVSPGRYKGSSHPNRLPGAVRFGPGAIL